MTTHKRRVGGPPVLLRKAPGLPPPTVKPGQGKAVGLQGRVFPGSLRALQNVKGLLSTPGPAMAPPLEESLLFFDLTLGSSQASFAIPGIPSGYGRFEIFLDGRGDASATNANVLMQFNSDTGTNYDYENAYFNGNTNASSQNTGQTSVQVGWISAGTAPASTSSQTFVRVANYSGTTFHKTFLSQQMLKQGVSANNLFVGMVGGWWRNTAAITRVDLTLSSGNFVAGSRCTVYLYP